MDYQGAHLIRPPSEAESIILQVTVGCSHNRCTFCGTYKEERFRLKKAAVIEADLDFAASYCRRQSRVFLADGDVLVLPQARLVELLTAIRDKLPWVRRVSLYANARAIHGKIPAQLAELKELGLDRVYLGVESGHDPTLAAVNKGSDAAGMLAAGRRVREAGLFLSVTVLLGIAGRENSLAHAEASGRLLAAIRPNQIGILTLILLPNTPLFAEAAAGRFTLPDQPGLLAELRKMMEPLAACRCQLQSNHPSNYLTLDGRLPRDHAAMLALIDQGLAGQIRLRPENRRAL